MIFNVLSGGAGINALGNAAGWEIVMVDAGVEGGAFPSDEELKPVCRFIRANIRGKGSRNFYREAALTRDEVSRALEKGRQLAADAAEQGYDLTAIGDLGIGNTSTAAALLFAAGFSADDMVDRGTGIDDAMLDHKRAIITEAVKRRLPLGGEAHINGEAILAALGSADFAMMAGFILGLENREIACVLDGFPVSSAAYMAYLINPRVKDWLFAGHLSRVAGHKPILDRLGLEPIVNLEMRLGEGTGAVIGGHIIELGVLAARNMASFAEAKVSDSEKPEKKF
jgi:nicotinate-nucleotide--dimethylbenzimidazole phosphoribosyltransferase